jgi:predicted Rossmann-fold nucleotide-binding protein
MKGPMKGASIGHAKQRINGARYVGLTEPGIIAAEPPNPMVNNLVVLPDIEKRLEAFVRMGHAFVVFPGGVGTAEEVLYLLGVLTDPANVAQGLPVLLTGPKESAPYFQVLDELIGLALGDHARRAYRIVIDDAAEVARYVGRRVRRVKNRRRLSGDAFYFNWLLKVPDVYQQPFRVTHESVAALSLTRSLPRAELAANLRRAFSAIVTGNVKDHGIHMIREHGPFEIRADVAIIEVLERVLQSFIAQGRMKLPGSRYVPCYRVVRA